MCTFWSILAVEQEDTTKDHAAVELAQKRTAKLSPRRWKRIAKEAAQARWRTETHINDRKPPVEGHR